MKFSVIYPDKPQFYSDRKLIRKDGKYAKYGFGATNNYSLMSDKDILALPVHKLADPRGAILMSWGTSPNTPYDMEVIKAWHFGFATAGWVWVKTNKNDGEPFFGVGSYTGSGVEALHVSVMPYAEPPKPCLLDPDFDDVDVEMWWNWFARFGDRVPERAHKDLRQVQEFPHPRYTADHLKVVLGQKKVGDRVHSGKPPQFRELIDRLYGDVPKIELFARDDAGPIPDHWYATGLEWDGLDVADAIEFYSQLPEKILPSIARVMAMALADTKRKETPEYGSANQRRDQSPGSH